MCLPRYMCPPSSLAHTPACPTAMQAPAPREDLALVASIAQADAALVAHRYSSAGTEGGPQTVDAGGGFQEAAGVSVAEQPQGASAAAAEPAQRHSQGGADDWLLRLAEADRAMQAAVARGDAAFQGS